MTIGKDIEIAKAYLTSDDVVAIPTETVYGLAGNAFSEKAVLKIFQTKNRPEFDPLIVHTHSIEKIPAFAELNAVAMRLFEAFSPGPLTILLPKKPIIPDLVTSGLPQVAVRIPNHLLTLNLLRGVSFPLAAPSANPFGYISPTTATHVAAQLGGKIPYILDGDASSVGVESTIIGFDNNETVVYRLGGLPIEAIEKVIGKVRIQLNQSSNPLAPGMLKSHYAPRKPLYLGAIANFLNKNTSITEGVARIGILSFQNDFKKDKRIVAQEILSKSGDVNEAAQRLFAAMRRLDASDADIILAEVVPAHGLGLAVNDRLRRASVNIF